MARYCQIYKEQSSKDGLIYLQIIGLCRRLLELLFVGVEVGLARRSEPTLGRFWGDTGQESVGLRPVIGLMTLQNFFAEK